MPELKDIPRDQIWEAVYAVEERMFEAAAADDWVQAGTLARQRDRLLRRFFSTPVPEGESTDVAIAIERIQEDNTRLLDMMRTARPRLQKKASLAKRSATAAAAYLARA